MNKCYVVFIEHVVYGTEIVGSSLSIPTTEMMKRMAYDYVRRYCFDQSEMALELEMKQITRIDNIATVLVD